MRRAPLRGVTVSELLEYDRVARRRERRLLLVGLILVAILAWLLT